MVNTTSVTAYRGSPHLVDYASTKGAIASLTIGLSNLLEAGSLQWGIGPALRLPLFDAGRLRANLRGKAADVDAAVESYNATLLDALHETADQIAAAQGLAA